MHCKIDVEKAVIKKAIEAGTTKNIKPFSNTSLLVNKKDFKAKGQTFKVATDKSEELNERFGDKLSYVNQVIDGHEIIIKPSEVLIDDYYSGYIETQGAIEQVDTGIDIFGDSKILASNQFKGNIDKDLQSKFFESFNESTAIDVLSKIANSKHSLAQLAKRLINHSKSNNVKIILENVNGFSMKELGNIDASDSDFANAYYNSKTNTIHIAKGGYFREGLSEATIIHEVLHSITFHKLNSSPSSDSTVRDFNKLYSYALTKLNKDDFYGLSDRHEFLVALFTDPKLVNALKDVESSKNTKQYTNLFKEIFDLILSIVGIGRTSSLYEQAFAVATHVVSEASESREALAESVNNEEAIVFSKAEFIPAPTFETQYVFFKRRINTLGKQLEKVAEGTDEYKIKESELKAITARFEKATEENNEEEYTKMGNEHLDWVEKLITSLPENPDKYTIANLVSAFEILNTFRDFTDLETRSAKLRKQMFPYIVKHNLKTINNYNTSGEEITEEMVDSQVKDERWSVKAFGSLSDIVNYIGRTVGSVIKTAQNKASTANKILEHKVQSEVDKLIEWGKDNNMSLEQVYDIFLQESKSGTLILTQRSDKDGKINENFTKILNDDVLKNFYLFYQRTLKDAESILPYKVGPSYVLNKVKSDLKSDLKRVIPTSEYLFDSFVSNEQLIADMVPDMFRTKISADKKSRDLGSGLLQFAAYANNHNELSNALPEVRLLQEQLKYRVSKAGFIEERTFIDAASPIKSIKAENSNVYNMVKIVIDMQVKGKMHENKMKPINIKEIKDAEGNIIGYKQLHVEDVIDLGLKYNSMLRIGFAPITALANVIFGDISNFIEAVGGRYFTVKQAHQATNIFFKQINYTSNDKSSNLYKWLEKLNPLQELADYDIGENLIANKKKLSKEKALELMYSMQKKGELYLQARTMLAMLIHEGYINEKGENLKKGDNITLEEATRLSDKIQRLNQQIHGRYSQREAATLQQSVWYRMVIQFKKWLPTALEQRMGDRKYDNRLGLEVEGRYRTVANLFFTKDALTNLNKMVKGELSELEMYNMKKTLMEAILISVTLLSYTMLHGGDDDKDKRKKAFIKAGMTLLNRASGDLIFFYSPGQVVHTAGNVAPLVKTASDILTTINNIPHAFYDEDSQFKSGSRKGNNKFYSKLKNVVPGFKPVADIQRMLNDNLLEELN